MLLNMNGTAQLMDSAVTNSHARSYRAMMPYRSEAGAGSPAGAGMERSGTGLNWRSQAPSPADESVEAASGDSSAFVGSEATTKASERKKLV